MKNWSQPFFIVFSFRSCDFSLQRRGLLWVNPGLAGLLLSHAVSRRARHRSVQRPAQFSLRSPVRTWPRIARPPFERPHIAHGGNICTAVHLASASMWIYMGQSVPASSPASPRTVPSPSAAHSVVYLSGTIVYDSASNYITTNNLV